MDDSQYEVGMSVGPGGDGEAVIPVEDIPAIKEAAQFLSRRLGVRLNFAHTFFLYASAANAGALEFVGTKWEGHYDDPAVLDAVAGFVEDHGGEGLLDQLLREPGPAAAERWYEDHQSEGG